MALQAEMKAGDTDSLPEVKLESLIWRVAKTCCDSHIWGLLHAECPIVRQFGRRAVLEKILESEWIDFHAAASIELKRVKVVIGQLDPY